MATALTPVRIARISRQSFQNTEETAELDFELALRQGVLIHAVEFAVGQAILVPALDNDHEEFYLSLHAETGALENALDALTDSQVLNSEVIAEAAGTLTGSATAGEETGTKFAWMSPIAWNFNQLLGGPLLLATNLTFRGVTTASILTINGAMAHIFYQYVELTREELANQFLLSR